MQPDIPGLADDELGYEQVGQYTGAVNGCGGERPSHNLDDVPFN